MEKGSMGLPKGTVRGVAFLSLIVMLILLVLTVVIGAIVGPLTFENLLAMIKEILPLVTLAFGFYYGQKVTE